MNTPATPMTLIDVFVAPHTLFEQVKSAKKYSWLAFALLLVVSSASIYLFFGGMSTDWVVEQQLLQAGELSPAERDGSVKAMTEMAPYLGTIGAVMAVVMTLVFNAIYAGYYHLAHKVGGANKQPMNYGDWFSVGIWTQMPMLVNTLGFIALFASAGTADLPMSLPNYASLNQLVLGYAPGEALFNWAEALNLFLIWIIALLAIAFQKLSDMSVAKSIGFAALPYVVFFGGWLAFV